MARSGGDPGVRGDRAARRRARTTRGRRGAVDGWRAAREAGSAVARRDARPDRGRARPLTHDERDPARPAGRPPRVCGPPPHQRLTRLAQSRALCGDHPQGCSRRGPARARRGRAPSGAEPDQGQLRRRQGLHRNRGPGARRPGAAQAVCRSLHRVHAARRRRGVARGRRAHRRRDPRNRRGVLRPPPRASREGLVDRTSLSLRRRRRRARFRQPRLRAVLLELRPDSRHRGRAAAHVPFLTTRVGPEGGPARRR